MAANAEMILCELLDKIASKHHFDKNNMTIKAITSDGANYTSALFVVTVKIPDKKDVELFAKVACMGDKLRSDINGDRIYRLEAFFYNKLSNYYRALEQKHNVDDMDKFVFPKFYGCNTNQYQESIVLENLVAKGFGSYSRFISVDWEHAAASIEALAKFHALSFAYQKEHPDDFAEACKDLVFVPAQRDQTKEIFDRSVERCVSVVKEEYKPRILQHLLQIGEKGFQAFMMPLKVKVIVHGDYRPSNILYKRQDDKVLAIPVDYQTIHFGSPASDLLYFVLCGTDSEFRNKHYDRLINHYYSELSAALQRLGVDPAVVYPREMLDGELKELKVYSVLQSTFLLPMVLVDLEQAPKLDGDQGLEGFIVPITDLFIERLSGIVEDCIRQGIL